MARQPRRTSLKAGAVHPADAQINAYYDAAGTGRRMAGWNPTSAGPNAVTRGLQNIRNRSRDTERNDWTGRSIVQKWVTTLVGIGVNARFDKIKNEARREKITELYDTFLAECDADGTSHGYGLQTLAVKTWFSGGECFVRERPREFSAPLSVPVQVQLLEPEMCPLLDADSWPGLPQGNKIRQGIETNKYDRRIAYWFYKSHPGESMLTRPGSNDLVRVPAAEVWHVYEPERPGAQRGVSSAAAVLTRIRDAGDFEDAVLQRQKLANLFAWFITRNLPTDYFNGEALDPVTGMPKVWKNGAPMVGLAPGAGIELRPGEDVKFANPPEAGTAFYDYMRYTHVGTAAGSGLPYEILTGDIREISDRTLRVVMNEFRRLAEQRQWQILIPKFCQKMVEVFARYAAIRGLVSVSEAKAIMQCTHSPHAWAYIHPVQDVQAEREKVEAGFKARSDVIGGMGDDPEATDRKRAADEKRERDLGVRPAGVKAAAPAAAPPNQNDPNDPTNTPDE